MSNNHSNSGNTNQSPKPFRLDLKNKKGRGQPGNSNKKHHKEASLFFDGGDGVAQPSNNKMSVREFDGTKSEAAEGEPLVIPVTQSSRLGLGQLNQLKKEQEEQSNNTNVGEDKQSGKVSESDADAEAIRALKDDAEDLGKKSSPSEPSSAKNLVIEASKDSFQRHEEPKQEERETEQFQKDLDSLPDAMGVEDYSRSRVPISEFGAAMLRGMGWKGDGDDNSNSEKKKDAEPSLPRPHRLGLGATPKLETYNDDDKSGGRQPRTMDQYKRDQKLKQQAEDFARQRQQQVKVDKQQTLQDGSLVLLASGQRASIVQLAGVPGLNQVRVHCEGASEPCAVKRGEVERLLTRQELKERPFAEPAKCREGERQAEGDSGRDRKRGDGKRDREQESSSSHRKRKRDRDEKDKNQRRRDDGGSGSRSSSRTKVTPTWVMPQIRVRIVTEKLGRRHFKEKGVVVDVTSKGSTVELQDTRAVLDRVPERYLETALPKAGGRVVILTDSAAGRDYLHSKGTLLERGRGRGVVQLDSDKSVLTVSLDDIAEWMGAHDEDD